MSRITYRVNRVSRFFCFSIVYNELILRTKEKAEIARDQTPERNTPKKRKNKTDLCSFADAEPVSPAKLRERCQLRLTVSRKSV